MSRRILITGSRGLLGSEITPLFREAGFDVIAPPRCEFDITRDNSDFLEKLNLQKEDIVLNLAAYTNVKAAEEETEPLYKTIAWKTNTSVDWLLELPCKIFHMSTDYVYSGEAWQSKETDKLRPFNRYAETKAIADKHLLSFGQDKNVTIIRTSFKPRKWPYQIAFDDMWTNADIVDKIAKMIFEFILLDPPPGVFNIGTYPKTVYTLARQYNFWVKPGSVTKVPFLKPCVTMDLTKYHNFLKEKKDG